MSTSKRTEPSVFSNNKRPLVMAAIGASALFATSSMDVEAQQNPRPVNKNDTIPQTKEPVISGIGKLKLDSADVAPKGNDLNVQKKKLTYDNTVQHNGFVVPEKVSTKSAKDDLWLSYLAAASLGEGAAFNWGGFVSLSNWIALNPEVTLTKAGFSQEFSYNSPQPFPRGVDSYMNMSRTFSQVKGNLYAGPTLSMGSDKESFIKPALVGTAISTPGGYNNDPWQADYAAGVGVMGGAKIADLGKGGSLMLFFKAEFMPLYHVNKYSWQNYLAEYWVNSPAGHGELPKRGTYLNAAIGLGFRFYDRDDSDKPLKPRAHTSNADAYQLAQQVKEEAETIRQQSQDIKAKNIIGQVTQVGSTLYENEDGVAYLDWSQKEMDVEVVPVMILFEDNAPKPSAIMSTQQGQFKTGLESTVEKYKTAALKTEERYSIKY